MNRMNQNSRHLLNILLLITLLSPIACLDVAAQVVTNPSAIPEKKSLQLTENKLTRELSPTSEKSFARITGQGINLRHMALWIGGLLTIFGLIIFIILRSNQRLRKEIKERQQAEARSQVMLDTIAECGEGLLIINPDYQIRYMNAVLIDWFGNQTGSICHDALMTLIQSSPSSRMGHIVQQEKIANYQSTVADGRTFEIFATRIRNLDGTTSTMKMIRDISERIRDLQSREENRQQLTLAMEAANLGFWDWRPQSDQLFTNDIFLTMLGHVPDAFPQTIERWTSLIHPDDLELVLYILQPFLDGDDSFYRTEHRLLMGDGKWKWILDVGRVVDRDKTGKAVRFVGVHIDISDRKQAEQQLVKARQQAEAASQAKSDFLATMSHEIRTPMNAIIGMSHLTLQTDLSRKQRNYVSNIDIAATSLLGIINDILDFSKIEAGKLKLEAIPFCLAEVLEKLANLTEFSLSEKKLHLDIAIAPEVPDCLMGDPMRLGQVLLNLINNGLKFTDKGGVTVRVSCLNTGTGSGADRDKNPEDTVLLLFSVTDTGIGMTEKQLTNLFTSFTQADSSTTRKFGGTGLGLTICKQLVLLMGGEIKAESQFGKGSVFSFILEFATTEEACTACAVREMNNSSLVAIQGAEILVVEDNAINQQVAQDLLKMKQIAVTIVDNGEEAVKAVKCQVFDAILMDIQMPVMDGYTATRKIRQDSQCKDVPIIAMTANAMLEDRQKCLDAGMNDFVAKPIDPNRLYRALTRWIPARERSGCETGTIPLIPFAEENLLPASLPGIDLKEALYRVGGNSRLLRKLLRQIYSGHRQDVLLIRQAMSSKDLEKARRITHTAKGLAGTIGATKLQQAVTAVDAAFKAAKNERIPALLEKMDIALQEVMLGLESIKSDPMVTIEQEATGEFNTDTVSALLDETIHLVHEFDPDTEEKAFMLTQLLAGSPHIDAAHRLLTQVEEAEFDRAEDTIQQLRLALQLPELND